MPSHLPTRLLSPIVLAIIALLLAPAGLVSHGAAKTAAVHLKDRTQPITGELVSENSEEVVLSIAGIQTTIDRNRIDRIEFQLTPVEEFKQKRAELDDDQHNRRYLLAREMYDRRVSDRQQRLALDRAIVGELQALVKAAPEMRQAELLRELTRNRVKRTLEQAEREAEDSERNEQTEAADSSNGADGRAADAGSLPLLDEAQRNILKVYEVALSPGVREQHRNLLREFGLSGSTRPPRVYVPSEAIDTLLSDFRNTSAIKPFVGNNGDRALRRMDGHEQLEVIFRARASELYPEVEVRDEPAVLKIWRTRIHPRMVVDYFAKHFDEEDIPGFRIHSRRPNREPQAYTNFLILLNLRVDGRDMIDLNRPEESLLVQWSLPRDEATFPAPEVRGWRPYFQGQDDPRLARFVRWTQQIYGRDYPIDLKMPQASPDEASQDTESGDGETDDG